MASFDRTQTSSYLSSIIIMAASRIVLEIKRYIGRKFRNALQITKQ